MSRLVVGLLFGLCNTLLQVRGDGHSIVTPNTDENEDERRPSMFKVGDTDEDWLALPEVFSKLDFNADNTPASEDDVEEQMYLRATRFWGRMYVEGWPQSIQFFRAHFGNEPPIGRHKLIFAQPRDGCSPFTNVANPEDDVPSIFFTHRGNCTFGTKAKHAHQAGGKAVIIINNEPGLEHVPGPDAHDIDLSVVSITQAEGLLMENVHEADVAQAGGLPVPDLHGYLIPINCENSGARCVPATLVERQIVRDQLPEGGLINVHPPSNAKNTEEPEIMEYLLAHFGAMVPQSTPWPVVLAKPSDACTPLDNVVTNSRVVYLVRRGGCSFVKKSEMVMAAGGQMMILGSTQPFIVRMGVEPRWKGLAINIPVVMVSKQVYGSLVAESYSGSKLTFSPDMRVNNTVWEYIEQLHTGQGWPRTQAYGSKKYEQLSGEYANWPDRTKALKAAYDKFIVATTPADTKPASNANDL